ncbi:MPN domain-containing protein-like isoform X2 [Pomacea canaliculata]|uniref:MPN domain-containing protein-like isoform X2 n=1 Tax=Pomacea canaliculata TaxID=400727 RepID=UPI000D729379|nr:MPN domain-containing protein-like isoform X2 [Pomacea canaliculata]
MASEDSQAVQEDAMKDEEEEEVDSEEDGDSLQKAKQALTGRGVTLSDLMNDGLIHAGQNVLSIDYRGQRFEADLLPSGKIRWQGSEEEFSTPSAWATHCKRLVNPIKRSGCGWASVKYKGRKLDTWKTVWSRKHRTNSPYRSNSPYQAAADVQNGSSPGLSCGQENGKQIGEPQDIVVPKSPVSETTFALAGPPPPVTNSVSSAISASKPQPYTSVYNQEVQEEALNLSMSGPHAVGKTNGSADDSKIMDSKSVSPCSSASSQQNFTSKCQASVSYSTLGSRSIDHNPNTFVKCEHFATLGRTQPFTVSISTNAMLLMDFHSHLTTSEVVGYLGGHWSQQTHHVRITQAFPCKCRLGDIDKAPIVEEEIRQGMVKQGCSLVGWYHSHPHSQADPTLKDIDCQTSYQLRMKGPGGVYLPCLGLIFSPYNKRATKSESSFEAFWILPPPEHLPTGYGMPMHMKCSLHQSSSLSEELLSEMNQLADYYRAAPDRVRWRELWTDSLTFMEKIKRSLKSKLPKDQMENGSFFAYMHQLLTRK